MRARVSDKLHSASGGQPLKHVVRSGTLLLAEKHGPASCIRWDFAGYGLR